MICVNERRLRSECDLPELFDEGRARALYLCLSLQSKKQHHVVFMDDFVPSVSYLSSIRVIPLPGPSAYGCFISWFFKVLGLHPISSLGASLCVRGRRSLRRLNHSTPVIA